MVYFFPIKSQVSYEYEYNRQQEGNTIKAKTSRENPTMQEQNRSGGQEICRQDSGYSTDSCRSSLTDSNEQEISSDSEPSVFQYDGSEEDDDGVSARIEFLNQKQNIMKRAAEVLAQEERYEAATAVWTSNQPPSRPSAMRREAMSVLRSMGHRSKTSWNRSEGRINRNSRKRKSPKDPAIDFSSVQRLPAAKFSRLETVATNGENHMSLLSSFPTGIFHQGQWMAKALVWSAPVQSREQGSDDRWQVVSDPSTYSLGLVPPRGISMKNTVDLQQAISISDEAHIVTQATPPFCVVYVNKAFLMIAGCESTETIIGTPVESMLQVSQDSFKDQPNEDKGDSSSFLYGIIRLGLGKACQIRISPVVDQSRQDVSSSGAFKHLCMSHVLIQISDSLHKPCEPQTTKQKASSLVAATVSEGQNDDEEDEQNVVLLGTVG